MNKLGKFAAACAAVLCGFGAVGADYYVAKDGSDENDGLSRETAKLDPEKLIPTLPAGSTVYIDEGTYTLTGDWIQLTNDIAVVGIGADRTAVKFNSARQDDPTTVNGANNKIFPDESSGRRLFRVASSGSRLVNVTLTDGAWEVYRMSNVQSPGALQVEAGLVSNCVIKASKGSDFNGGAALVTGGTVTHSLFYGNQAYRSSNAGAQTVGGAIKQTGGLVECCVLSNNTCVSEGGNLWISGGVFRRSRICKTTSTSRVGVAAHVEGTALVELCEIDHIQADSAVVSQTGGTVRNCFIHDNTAANEAGGIRLTGGTAEYCTVVNNKSQNVKTGGIYLNGANAVARYNVSYLNGDTAANAACNLKIEKGTATDNVATDPSFADAPNGDFSLGAGSPAIDIVAAMDGVTNDIGGNARPKDGDGDGEARNDAGCFEAPGANEGPLRCSFAVTGEAVGLNRLETTFKASVAGEGADGEIVYSWDLNGDGVVDFTGAQYQTVSWTYENCGRFDVSLVVSNGKDSVGFTYPGCIGVGASRIYVNAENKDNAVWPYATWETAASDINEAFDTILWTDGVKVDMIVTNGTYKINSKWLMIEKPMTLTSVEGPEKTILSANNTEATNKRRVMYVNNNDAFVSGFTMRDGNWQAYYHQDIGPGALRLEKGVVSNCIFTANLGEVDSCGAVQMNGGTLTHSLFYGNTADHGTSGGRVGRGTVQVNGGLLEYCIVTNNNCNGKGQGLYQTGGTVRHCRFAEQVKQTQVSGAGVYITGGLLELCEIDNNRGSESTVVQDGGTVRNCFIHDNKVTNEGGGVNLTKGTLEFSTVVNNTSTENKTGGVVVNGADAVAQYNITYLNGDAAGRPTCNLNVLAGTSTQNVSVDPGFTDAENGDFTPAAGSPAIDKAVNSDEVVVDFAGRARPTDGDGDGTAVNDCGCFEALDASDGPMACNFGVTGSPRGLDTLETSFEATVTGHGSKGEVTYYWDLDGDGVVDASGTDKKTVEASYDKFGYYDVTLWTSNGTDGATRTVSRVVGVGSGRIYVNAANKDGAKWPYASWETAAADINVAYDTILWADGVAPEIVVTNGTYDIVTKWLIVESPLTLRSVEGPEKTILRARNVDGTEKRRVLYMNNENALVAGFTLRDANWQGFAYGDQGAGALRLLSGVVSNCIIEASVGQVSCAGGAEIRGGVLTHTVLRGNSATQGGSSGSQAYGGALRVTGGTVEHCTITNNYISKYADISLGRGGALYLDGEDAVVRNCTIADNWCKWTGGDGTKHFDGTQVYVVKGLLENCVIGDMKHVDCWGCGVYQKGGTVRNCLLKGICSKDPVQVVQVAGGSFYNNTVVTNGWGAGANASPVAAVVTGGEVVNCIFAENAGEVTDETGLVRNSCYPEADGTRGNLAADPKLRNPKRDDWRVRSTSPCVNAGDGSVWEGVEDPTDLRGYPRVLNQQVDMGCYEVPQTGLRMIVR